MNKTRYIKVTDWANHHPWPVIGGLRHLIFHEESNGFSTVVKRVGRTILIDEAEFFKWMENHDNQGLKKSSDEE